MSTSAAYNHQQQRGKSDQLLYKKERYPKVPCLPARLVNIQEPRHRMLLDQQLEKLKIHKVKETRSPPESESESQSSSTSSSGGLEAPPKMRVLKRNMPLPASSAEVRPMESPVASTNGMLNGGGVIQEESPRTQYVPPEPRISVLSRPKKKSAEDMNSNGKSKNQPVKTLEQREQEYAEARRRIFGDTQVES